MISFLFTALKGLGPKGMACSTLQATSSTRLIPGMQESWNHPKFFAYADRWMFSPDDPLDLEFIRSATGMTIDPDFMQGQSWKILSGGGYY